MDNCLLLQVQAADTPRIAVYVIVIAQFKANKPDETQK